MWPGCAVSNHRIAAVGQVTEEPVAGHGGCGVEGARLLEQVGRAGTTASWFSQRSRAWARRLRSSTTLSWPPTMSSVGAVTAAEAGARQVGTAAAGDDRRDAGPGSAAAHSAAAAPVLAPK